MSLMQLNFDEANNLKHKYKVMFNGIDFSTIISGRDKITIRDELSSDTGSFKPKSVTIKMDFGVQLLSEDLRFVKFTNRLLRDLYYTDQKIRDWIMNEPKFFEFKISDLVTLGDELEIEGSLEGETYTPFKGTVRDVSITYSNGATVLEVTAKTEMKDAYTINFDKDEVMVDWYISNNSVVERSLTHRLAKALGYNIADIEADDLVVNQKYLTVPFFKEVKGEKIISYLAELVRSFSGILKLDDGKIYIKKWESIMFPTNQVGDKRNILGKPKIVKQTPDYKAVKVMYDKYVYSSQDIVWYMAGADGTPDDAKMYISANSPKDEVPRYRINWVPSGLVKSYENPIVEAQDKDGNSVDLQWEFEEISLAGGLVVFWNDLDKDVFIKKFVIEGVPVKVLPGNEMQFESSSDLRIYTADFGLKDHEILKAPENIYIQTPLHANYYLQLQYLQFCRDFETYSFGFNHCMGFMKSGSNILLRHDKLEDKNLLITNFKHDLDSAEIKARTFENFSFDQGGITEIDNSNANYDDVRTGNIINDNDVLNPDKPSPPTFALKTHSNGFSVVVIPSDEGNVRGYYAYTRRSTDSQWNREFFGATNFFKAGAPAYTYEVKLTAVNYNGVESDETGIQRVKPLKLNSDDINFSPGQSPQEQEKARKELQDQLEEDIKKLEESGESSIREVYTKISDVEGEFSRVIGEDITDLEDGYVKKEFSKIEQTTKNISLEVSKMEGDINNLNDPTYLVSKINLSPDGVEISGNHIQIGSGLEIDKYGNVFIKDVTADVLRIGDNFYADKDGNLQIKNMTIGQIGGLNDTLKDLSDVSDDIKEDIKNGKITLTSDTNVYGEVSSFDGGFSAYDGPISKALKKSSVVAGKFYHAERLSVNSPWVETTVVKKIKAGVANDGDVVDLRAMTGGIPWGATKVIPTPQQISIDGDTREFEANAYPLGNDKYRIDVKTKSASTGDFKLGKEWNQPSGIKWGQTYTDTYTFNNCRAINLLGEVGHYKSDGRSVDERTRGHVTIQVRETVINTGVVSPWKTVYSQDFRWNHGPYLGYVKNYGVNTKVEVKLTDYTGKVRFTDSDGNRSEVSCIASLKMKYMYTTEAITNVKGGKAFWFASEV